MSTPTTPLRRHLRWILPPTIGASAALLLWTAIALLNALPDGEQNAGTMLLRFGLLLLCPTVLIVGIGVGMSRLAKEIAAHHHERRRARGTFTAHEIAERLKAENSAAAWNRAVGLRQMLERRELSEPVVVWDVVPFENEHFFMDGWANYERYYGHDVTYLRNSTVAFGHPLFVATAFALGAAGNASRRSQAERAALEQWREQQSVRLVVSNHRLLVRRGAEWLSFPYSSIRSIHPDPASWRVICEFEGTAPLMLSGEWVPAASVVAVMMTHGVDALSRHPGLAPLREPSERLEPYS